MKPKEPLYAFKPPPLEEHVLTGREHFDVFAVPK